MYPLIDIKLDGIISNLEELKNECSKQNISFSLVTKMLVGYKPLVDYIVKHADIGIICDSRIKNLHVYSDVEAEKWLIRSPMISEVADVVRYSDASINSELSVIRALNMEAINQNKKHRIILMAELGDLRDGCYIDELADIISECETMTNVEVYGICANLSCVNDTFPDEDNMNEFIDIVTKLEKHFKMKFKIVSAGASSCIPMLYSGKLPEGVNNLRMGEGVYLGNVPVINEPFNNAVTDNFVLKAEIIELKKKPSVPGVKPDETSLKTNRALVALGKQDIFLPGLKCIDKKCTVIGGSSDHVIVDVTDSDREYAVGDTIDFLMNYTCLLNAMNSKYVSKRII
ncbi:MAG: alanine racemase [Clostridia bacterium]|nr:alanine racemase [Clostridia bacterium]